MTLDSKTIKNVSVLALSKICKAAKDPNLKHLEETVRTIEQHLLIIKLVSGTKSKKVKKKPSLRKKILDAESNASVEEVKKE